MRPTLEPGVHEFYRQLWRAAEENMESYAPIIDPYAEGVKRLRAASATPESTAEDRFKTMRFAQLADEHDAIDAETPLRVLSDDELRAFEPPCAYARDLKVLKERDARAREAKERR